MMPYWQELHGNPHSSEHSVGWSANKAVETARGQVATLIGSDSDEIIFTSGATESNNIALKGLCGTKARRKNRDRILISEIEHKCVFESAKYIANALSYQLSIIPVDRFGKIDQYKFSKLLNEDVQLVSIGLVNNEIGTIQNIDELSTMCQSVGAYFHSDCAQAPNACELFELAALTDAASFSGHKFGGPMGVGALYLRRDLMQNTEPLIHGGGQESGIRSGTLPLPLCVGMGAASDLVAKPASADERTSTVQHRNLLVSILHSSKYQIELNGYSTQDRHPGNANLLFHGFDAQDILMRLQPKIAASSGSACTSGIPESSHVLKAIGLNSEQASGSIRFSVGSGNTKEEIETAAAIILNVLESIEE